MTSEENIVIRVYKDFQYVPKLQLSITVYNRLTLQQFRDLLYKIQDNHRRLYKEKIKIKEPHYSSRVPFNYFTVSRSDQYTEKSYERGYEK